MSRGKSSTEVVKYTNLKDFYPFYLTEHLNPINRLLHFVGSSLVLLTLLWIVVTGNWNKLYLLPLEGYGFAWVGHFFFEKNQPATFKYPLFSFASDWILWSDIVRGKQPLMPSAKRA